MQKFLSVSRNISKPIKQRKNWIKKFIGVHSKLKCSENIWGKFFFERPVLKEQHCLQKSIFPFSAPLKSVPIFPRGCSASWLACHWRVLSLWLVALSNWRPQWLRLLKPLTESHCLQTLLAAGVLSPNIHQKL